jgi:hypothetical protein
MSALGQKQTSRFEIGMSALPSKADIACRQLDVRFVPEADVDSVGKVLKLVITMKFPRRQFLHLAAGAAALPAPLRFASAQTYPSRPVRWIVAYPAGGAPTFLRG